MDLASGSKLNFNIHFDNIKTVINDHDSNQIHKT